MILGSGTQSFKSSDDNFSKDRCSKRNYFGILSRRNISKTYDPVILSPRNTKRGKLRIGRDSRRMKAENRPDELSKMISSVLSKIHTKSQEKDDQELQEEKRGTEKIEKTQEKNEDGSENSEVVKSKMSEREEVLLGELEIVAMLKVLYFFPSFGRTHLRKIFSNVMSAEYSRKFIFRVLFGILTNQMDGDSSCHLPESVEKNLLIGAPKDLVDDDEEETEGEETERKKKKGKIRVEIVRERTIDLLYVLSKENHTFTEMFTKIDPENGILRPPINSLVKIFHHCSSTRFLQTHVLLLVNHIYNVVKLKREDFGRKRKKMNQVVLDREKIKRSNSPISKKKVEKTKKDQKNNTKIEVEKKKEEDTIKIEDVMKNLESTRIAENNYMEKMSCLLEPTLVKNIVQVLVSRKDKEKGWPRKYYEACFSVLQNVGDLGGIDTRIVILQELVDVLAKISSGLFRRKEEVEQESRITWKDLDPEKVFLFQRFIQYFVDLFVCVNKDELYPRSTQFFHENYFDHIWEKMNTVLRGVDFSKPSEETSVLMPLIQSFLLFHSMFFVYLPSNRSSQIIESVTSQEKLDRKNKTIDVVSEKSSAERSLEFFFREHGDCVNDLLFTNPQLLIGGSGSMEFLLFSPVCNKYVSFENKKVWFRNELRKLQEITFRKTSRVRVRRASIFIDALRRFSKMRPSNMMAKLKITFVGEQSVDAGGLTRDFLVLLSQSTINPDYGLFKVMDDKTRYRPNPLSGVIEPTNHLEYFKFAGRVIGMSIYHGHLIDACFSRDFYKNIVGQRITFNDVEGVDPQFYKNLTWVIENDVSSLGLTFSLEENVLGRVTVYDLKPNGRTIQVTNKNKLEYVKLATHFKMVKGIEDQMNAFLQGFYELIPKKLISIFTEQELEVLINGAPDFNVDRLRSKCTYQGYKENAPVVQWFWKWMEGLNNDEKSLFVQFVNGTTKIQSCRGGFGSLYGNFYGVQAFSIRRVKIESNMKGIPLPRSHTDFNQLDLPEYKSEEKLRKCCFIMIRDVFC